MEINKSQRLENHSKFYVEIDFKKEAYTTNMGHNNITTCKLYTPSFHRVSWYKQYMRQIKDGYTLPRKVSRTSPNFLQYVRYYRCHLYALLYIWLTLSSCSGQTTRDRKHKTVSTNGKSYIQLGFLPSYIYEKWHIRRPSENSNSFEREKTSIDFLHKYSPLFRRQKLNSRFTNIKAKPTDLTYTDSEITGMWAVKLKLDGENDSREYLDLSAEEIARQHGLENHGQIGELRGYYLFTKKDVSETWTTMASAIVSSSGQEGSERRTTSDGTSAVTNIPSSTTPLPITDPVTTTLYEVPDTPEPPITTSSFEEIPEPTHGWNVERGLLLHNQVEWQGHQVLLSRSKRGYIPISIDKDDEIADIQNENYIVNFSSSLVVVQNQSLTSTTVKPSYESNTTLVLNTIPNAPPSSPNPSDTVEEKSRHSFYMNILNMRSRTATVTPQQVEVTHNQRYKDLVGSSGGGIGGRRMGIDVEEEESAGDWWPSDTLDLEISDKRVLKMGFNDPLYGRQWHLKNAATSETGNGDCNVTGVWKYGIIGKGVVVAVVDDGVQWDHPDLIGNYCPEGSFDLNANDDDPMPVRDSKEENKHGTRCAGEIAAVPNNHCGVGVAYGARFSGIRILDGPLTDSMEAAAFNKHLDVNDIYSCSWGPEDDGKTVDGPHPLAQAALKHGVVAGREGFGSIYIVASGNGGHKGDNCNYDGYANSIYTITVGAVDEFGRVPSYAEECASMLACTFSSGAGTEDGNARKIVTTDWTLGKNKKRSSGCTESHTGTSAATPLAAGMVALMLEARPCLTWRDIQHIIVMTAIKIKPESEEWTTNTAGYHHSDKRGFGLLNAWRLVNAARVWRSVPSLTSLTLECPDRRRVIPNTKKRALILKTLVTEEQCHSSMVYTLEQVLVTVDIEHPRRGDLFLSLVCPSGTISVIGAPRKNDDSTSGLWNWTFTTVKCWGEQPFGTYRLIIHDTLDRPRAVTGELRSWKLTLYGSTLSQLEIDAQRKKVEASMSGEYLQPFNSEASELNNNQTKNESIYNDWEIGYCPPPRPNFYQTTSLDKPPERTLKLIALSGCFLLLWGLYCSFDVSLLQKDKLLSDTDTKSDTSKKGFIVKHSPSIAYEKDASDRSPLLENNSSKLFVWWDDITYYFFGDESLSNKNGNSTTAINIKKDQFLINEKS